nr:MAG TPA: N-terminal conserved domain of Nudc [Caudoviricetes sp.]
MITRFGAMWQMITGFLYRKTNFENNRNYLPHCPKQKRRWCL